MIKYVRIVFLSVLIINSYSGKSQQYNRDYELKGNLNNAMDGGKVYLSTGFIDTIYYEPIFKQLNSLNNKGEFCFKGNISYPHGVRLAYGDSLKNYYSGIIFIEPGKMNLKIDVDSNKVTPLIINSKSNEEYINNYLIDLLPVTSKEKSLDGQRKMLLEKYNNKIPVSISNEIETSFSSLRLTKDTILLKYITRHPDSYVGLWILIQNFSIFGYKQIYYDAYQRFSDSLKATYSGKILSDKLNNTKISNSKGRLFPSIKVTTTTNKIISVPLAGYGKKYILIDFWASYCAPCIRQFDKLGNIYKQYNTKGFEIVGISIDKNKDNWLAIIKEHQISWKQYLDVNGVESKKISVNAIPVNYLLDENGEIITKNISLDELSSFLKQNLN